MSATQLATRLAELADLGRAALVDARSEQTRAQVRFAAHAGVRDRVQAIVIAEAQCCPFLTMRVREESDTVLLSIEAPDGAELVVRELVDTFRGRPQPA